MIAVAAWFASKSFERGSSIARLIELVDVERAEKREWQNKWLAKTYGLAPLGSETKEKPKSDITNTTPRVVMRGEMEARTSQININANGARNPIVDRAEKIINET